MTNAYQVQRILFSSFERVNDALIYTILSTQSNGSYRKRIFPWNVKDRNKVMRITNQFNWPYKLFYNCFTIHH